MAEEVPEGARVELIPDVVDGTPVGLVFIWEKPEGGWHANLFQPPEFEEEEEEVALGVEAVERAGLAWSYRRSPEA